MKVRQHKLLKFVYQNQEVDVRDLLARIPRRHSDHRDFYGLVALLRDGYVGFTGANFEDSWKMTQVFQCYAQGQGYQSYGGMELMGPYDIEPKIYIGSKGLLYFAERNDQRMNLLLGVVLGVITTEITQVIFRFLSGHW